MVNDGENYISPDSQDERRPVSRHLGESVIHYPRIMIDDNGVIKKNEKKISSIAAQNESERLLLNGSVNNSI